MKFSKLEMFKICKVFWMISCCLTFINVMQAQENRSCNDTDFEVHVTELSKQRGSVGIREYIDSLRLDRHCQIRLFAYVVDRLLANGLDLDYKVRRTHREDTVENNRRSLYRSFLDTKIAFAYYYKGGRKGPGAEYQSVADSVLEYNVFQYPDQVKLFLNFKFKKHTYDRYYRSMRKAMKKKIEL